jgi:signal transduction histidine kinase/CheY-like chemotaxis protein
MADISETANAPRTAASAATRRPWFRSVAGKLLIAFALIVALTVAGAVVSNSRFTGLETVLQRLIGVSIPAVRTSLGIETNATQVAVSAAQLGNAEDSVQLFSQNEKLATQIQDLWAGLTALRAVVGETAATQKLEKLIAAIDGKVGELNREATERITVTDRRDKIDNGLPTLVESLSARVTDLQGAAAPGASPVANAAMDIARQSVALSALITRMATSMKADQFAPLREQFAAAKQRLGSDVEALAAALPAGDQRPAAVTAAANALFAQIEGDRGLLAVRERELRSNQVISGLQTALEASGKELRDQVRALVSEAERESAASTQSSVDEIARSRLWLILIAVASLILAALVVRLFVFRYVVERLTSLSNSMLAIAQGDLSAPIPAGKADELGEMSRALVTFRNNAREIRSAREEAEKARAEAEAASRTKSSFLANMSHELRTPLNAIIGYSEILMEDATDRGDKASVGDLEKIQAAGKHLLGLINDILDLSKIEAGRMDVYLEQVFLSRLVDDVKTIVEPMVKKNGNTLVIECPSDIGSLRTDLTKLKQSLINLLSNAAKFTKQGKVTLRLIRENGSDGKEWVKFEIADSGIGMTPEQMSRLFQAFTQADSSTTRNFGGTGLGLTITKHFCTMLGGSIDVKSTPGAGSTFILTLPVEGAIGTVEKIEIDRETAGAAPGTISVMVVDDDPVVHDVLTATLSKEGYRLLHAADGMEALEMMRAEPPDIVTLDVMMPKVDGWSVLGIMKSEQKLEHIPVIMLTIVDDRNLGYSLGASEYMTKPIDRNRLIGLIQKFAPGGANAPVLIVDDDPDVRALVKSTIEDVGMRTAEADNGKAAMEWLEKNPKPALVLLDLMMPKMDGFEFLERVRSRPDFFELPIVVLTAKELTENERSFLAENTLLILNKSAQPIGSLGSAIAAIAGRRAAAAAPAN